MNAWMIRGGQEDEFVRLAKDYSVAILGFFHTPNLSSSTPDQIRQIVRGSFPELKEGVVTRYANEISRFRFEINEGDLIVMPYHSGRRFLVGQAGAREYWFSDRFPIHANHFKAVTWKLKLTREQLPDGLWDQMQGRLTVKRLKVENMSGLLSVVQIDEIAEFSEDFEVLEGLRRRAERSLLSRSKQLVANFWNDHLVRNAGLGRCEVCDFAHSDRGMFDVHHLRPIALGEGRRTRFADLALLCPRCHRLAHLDTGSHPHSIEALRKMI